MQIILNIVIVILLVFLNGFFVAAEFSVVKIRKSRVDTLLGLGTAGAIHVKRVVEELNAYLSACQLGITLASLGLGWVGEPAVSAMIRPALLLMNVPEITIHAISLALGFTIITACHIVLGELVPKSLSIINAEKVALVTALPLIWFYRLTYPVIWFFNATTSVVLKIFGISMNEEHEAVHTDDEIKKLIEESYKHGMFDQAEYSYVENIFGFSDKKAKEIMTPRTDMICISKQDSIDKINELIINEQLTRYPVYEDNKDNIIGFINIKDLYNQITLQNEISIVDMMRDILFVPENTSLSTLLKTMQKKKTQMAILIDEYGGTCGLVTTEDILEEIVGSIQDEYDDETDEVQEIDEGTYLLDGDLQINEVNELLELDIDADGIDTIGGWLVSLIEDLAEPGQQIIYGGYVFVVNTVLGHRILKIDARRVSDMEVRE